MFHVKHLPTWVFISQKSTIFCLKIKYEIQYFDKKKQMFHVKHLKKSLTTIVLMKDMGENILKEIEKNRISNVKISLHDAYIEDIIANKNNIEFKIKEALDYSEDESKKRNIRIIFQDVDFDVCGITLIKEKNGEVTGKEYGLKKFIKKNLMKGNMEIISETYNRYDTVWIGYHYGKKGRIKKFIIEIWNHGKIVYRIPDIKS